MFGLEGIGLGVPLGPYQVRVIYCGNYFHFLHDAQNATIQQEMQK